MERRPENDSITKQIEDALEKFFPGIKEAEPAKFDEVKKRVKEDLSQLFAHMPSLASNAVELQSRILHSIHKHHRSSLEKQIENVLIRDYPNIKKGTPEFDKIKEAALEEMNNFSKEAPTLAHNPKTREYFITLLINQQCLKQELVPTNAPEKSISRLKRECLNLINEIEKKDTVLADKLKMIFKNAKQNIEKEGTTPEEKLEALKGIVTLANMILAGTQENGPKQFADLPPEERTNILSYGANVTKGGTYQITPQTTIPIPDLIIHLHTPIAAKKLDEEPHHLPKAFDPRAGLTPDTKR